MEMVKKLEITHKLEQLAKAPSRKRFRNRLLDGPAILNLPAPYYCSRDCAGCITKNSEIIAREREGKLPPDQVLRIIDFFAEKYQTKFITINGRGDPFHPKVQSETLEKIIYAKSKGIQAYVFSAGDNLDEGTCKILAEHEVNVMISLFGNPFADEAAGNIRTLIQIYAESPNQPEEGSTRLGMNYVVGPEDFHNQSRLMHAKRVAHSNGLFFVCNTNSLQESSEGLLHFARENTDFEFRHSTFVDGRCQMGAGSSITVAANGDIHRCPYMLGGSDGKIMEMPPEEVKATIYGYLNDREYSCVLRKTKV